MENAPLTGHQKAYLRGLGQTLDASLSVGKGGVTQTVVRELERLLANHELVKVRLLAGRDERGPLMDKLAAETHSQIVGSVGKTVVLFRRGLTKASQKISLPKPPAA